MPGVRLIDPGAQHLLLVSSCVILTKDYSFLLLASSYGHRAGGGRED
jgi:hypothetical protein